MGQGVPVNLLTDRTLLVNCAVYVMVFRLNVHVETGRLDQWLTSWSEPIKWLSAQSLKTTLPGVFQFEPRIGFLHFRIFFGFSPSISSSLGSPLQLQNLFSFITVSLLDTETDTSFLPIRLVIIFSLNPSTRHLSRKLLYMHTPNSLHPHRQPL